jgi:ribose-phosphate pyrophosphokinase
MILIAGNSNRPLAEAISAYLNTPLTEATIRRFSDMEIFVEILENIRGEDVFVIQSTSYPANDNLMELLIIIDALRRIIDALRRASARRITTVLPYFGYARQDRKTGPRTPISAKLVANLITTAGANRVLTLDLHAGQIQGFFDIPLDNLTAEPVLVKDIETQYGRDNLVIVSPDVGGVIRARAIAKRLDAELAIIDKRRERAGVSEVMNVIGEIAGRRCILVDDIVDSAGTLVVAAVADRDHGQHHGDGGGSGVGECPPVDDRTAARRGDPPDQRRDLGLEPVPLIFPGVGTPGGRRRLFRSEGVPDG